MCIRDRINSLRIEAVQKLKLCKPISIGQASRISGVSPADISVLLVYLEPVSYTHLDVYKRQHLITTLFNGCVFGPPLPFTATSSWTWIQDLPGLDPDLTGLLGSPGLHHCSTIGHGSRRGNLSPNDPVSYTHLFSLSKEI